MTLVAETVQINGQDVAVFRITGHPVEDLVVLTNTLSETDKQRLIKAASGDLKANDNTKIGEDELTGVALALLQAVFPEINRGPFQIYGNLFQSLAKITENVIKGDIAANLVQYVYDLLQTGDGGNEESGLGDLSTRVEAVESDLTSITGEVSTLKSSSTQIETELGSLVASIGGHTTQLEDITTQVGDLSTRMETLETDAG